jgi:hypothetical protein
VLLNKFGHELEKFSEEKTNLEGINSKFSRIFMKLSNSPPAHGLKSKLAIMLCDAQSCQTMSQL